MPDPHSINMDQRRSTGHQSLAVRSSEPDLSAALHDLKADERLMSNFSTVLQAKTVSDPKN